MIVEALDCGDGSGDGRGNPLFEYRGEACCSCCGMTG